MSESRPAKLYREARARLRRIHLGGAEPLEFVVLVVWLLVLVLFVIPWIASH